MIQKILLALGIAALLPASMECKHENPRIFYSSIRQSGTHLLQKFFQLLTDQSSHWIASLDDSWSKAKNKRQLAKEKLSQAPSSTFSGAHMSYHPEFSSLLDKMGYKKFFIFRDPRAQVVSRAHWILDNPEIFPQHAPHRNKPGYFDQLLMDLIKEVPHVYRKFMPWKKDHRCYSVRFEDLVGPQGGGSAHVQLREMRNMAEHLGIPYTEKMLKKCAHKIFGGTFTFRKGQIKSWKSEFTKRHKEAFKRAGGSSLLIHLGYEENDKW